MKPLFVCCLFFVSLFTQETMEEFENLSLEELLHVKLTIASKSKQDIKDAPAVVTVYGKKEMVRFGWKTLFDALDDVPGFLMRWQVNGGRGIVVRGMHALDGVLVMVDGISLNDPVDGNFSHYDLPLYGIEQIEIIRGPGSALYGGSAFLAVINLISEKSYISHTKFNLNSAIATEKSYHLSSVLYHKTEGAEFRVYGDLRRFQDVEKRVGKELVEYFISDVKNGLDSYNVIATDNHIRHTEFDQWNLGFHGKITSGLLKNMSLNGLFIHKETLPRLSWLYALPEQGLLERRDDIQRFSLTHTIDFTQDISLKPKLYFSNVYYRHSGQITRPYEWRDDEDWDGITERWPGGRIEVRSYLVKNMGAELSTDILSFENHTLIAGGIVERNKLSKTQYYSNSSNDINGEQLSINVGEVVDLQLYDPKRRGKNFWITPHVERDLMALYLQDKYTITDDISITAGLRYDSFSDFGDAVSPRAVLVYRPNKDVVVKLIYGEAFKPPTFISLYDETITELNSRRRYGNPNLNPSFIKTVEALFGYDFTAHIRWQMNAFWAQTFDEVIFDPVTESYQNSSERETRGFETELKAVWARYNLSASYGFNAAKKGSGTGAPIYPQHQMTLHGAITHLFKHFSVGSTVTFRSEYLREQGDTRSPISSQSILQAYLTYQTPLEYLSLTLQGSNLLNTNLSSPTDKSLMNILPDGVPREGRYLEVQVQISY